MFIRTGMVNLNNTNTLQERGCLLLCFLLLLLLLNCIFVSIIPFPLGILNCCVLPHNDSVALQTNRAFLHLHVSCPARFGSVSGGCHRYYIIY